MFVIYLNALQAINVLHFVNHIISQSFHTHNRKNIMGCRIAIHDVIPLFDKVTLLNWDMLTLWHHVLNIIHTVISRLNRYTAFIFIVFTKTNVAVYFGNYCMVFWSARLEQFGHPRQATCNILRPASFTRNPCQNISSFDFLSIFNRQDCVNRHCI